jgi:hypothetical protein
MRSGHSQIALKVWASQPGVRLARSTMQSPCSAVPSRRTLVSEVLSFQGSEWRLTGTAVFASDGRPCRLDYLVVCDPDWRTRTGRVTGWLGTDLVEVEVAAEAGRWRLNGVDCPAVAGCVDLDLNFSPSTNLLPIRRLGLPVGASVQALAQELQLLQRRIGGRLSALNVSMHCRQGADPF